MKNALLLIVVFPCISAFHRNVEEIRFPDVGPASGHKKNAASTMNNHYTCPNKECENAPNYPAKDIERIVIDKQLQNFFEPNPVAAERTSHSQAPAGRSASGPRSPDVKEDKLCPTEEIVRYPRLWKLNGTEYTIVQNVSCTSKTGRCYQSVRVVKCKGENKPCSEEHTNILQAGTTTVCEQEYSYSRLLVFNSSNQAVESNIFPIPCGCQCKLIRGSLTPLVNRARLESVSEFVDSEIYPPISRKGNLNFRNQPTYDPEPRKPGLYSSNNYDNDIGYQPIAKPHYRKSPKTLFYPYDGRYGTPSRDPLRSNVIPYYRYHDDRLEENETEQTDDIYSY